MSKSDKKRGRPGQRMRPTSSSKATQATQPWEFGGNEYELAPLTLQDMGTITEAMRKVVMGRYRDMLDTDELAEESAKLILDQGYERADRIDLLKLGAQDPEKMTEAELKAQLEMLALLTHPHVVITTLWCSLHHEHPRTKRGEVGHWFTAADEDVAAFNEGVSMVWGMSGVDMEQDTPTPDMIAEAQALLAKAKEAGGGDGGSPAGGTFRPGGDSVSDTDEASGDGAGGDIADDAAPGGDVPAPGDGAAGAAGNEHTGTDTTEPLSTERDQPGGEPAGSV